MERPADLALVSPRLSRRQGRGDDGDRRDELLRRITHLILDQGFANLTVDELAARLQCSKSTLYLIARSRELLVTTAINSFLGDVDLRIEEAVAQAQHPVDRLVALLTTLGHEMSRMSRRCFDDVGAHDATRQVYVEHAAAIRSRIDEFVRDGIADGSFRPVDSAFVADAISLLIDGIQWGRLLEDTELTPENAYEAMIDLALAALATRSAG